MGADSLYYIRDYSGNYYRINNVNELVAVRNETDATVFNYDQAKSHIGTGKKSAFYRAIPIETEDGNDGGNIAFNSVEVREDRDGRTAGGPVGLPKPWPGSQVRKG